MLMLGIAMIVIAVASSTREGRAEARQRLRRWNGPLWIATAAIWAVLLAGLR